MTTMTPSSSPAEAISDMGRPVSEVRPTRTKRVARRAVFILVLLAAGITGWSMLPSLGNGSSSDVTKFTVAPRAFSVMLKEKGELKAATSTDIVCEVEGRSTIISLVKEGKAVKKGELLVELASDEIKNRIQQEELKEANAIAAYEAAKTELEIQRDRNESDIRKAELKIELTKLELEKYEKADWTQRLKDADIAIKEARITRDRRLEDYEAAVKLLARNFITKTEFAESKFASEKAVWDLEKAEHSRKVLEKYTHVAELRQRESDVEEAIKECGRTKKSAEAEEAKQVAAVEGRRKELQLNQDQLAKLRRQQEQCRIYAPTQGFVVYYDGGGYFMSSDNQIREGASVRERQVLLSLPDTSKMLVVVRVHESKASKLSLGQKARVTVEGLEGQEFDGTVTKIAVLADTQNRWLNPDLKEYETEITLDASATALKPGATAFVKILVEHVDAAAAVPVQAIYTVGNRRFVFEEQDGDVSFSQVEIGSIGMEWAEVTKGVRVGEQVLLAFNDEHIRMIPDVAKAADGNSGSSSHRGRKGRPGGKGKPSRRGHGKSSQARTSHAPAGS